MKYFSITLFLLPTIILCSACKIKTNKNGELINKWKQTESRLDSIAEKILLDGKVNGFSIAILNQNDTIYNKGFGFTDSDGLKPVTTETKFLMASISKLVTAVVVMKLIEEDKLSLNQSLYEVFPEYPNPEQAKKISIKHLLNHTSGIPDYVVQIDSIFLIDKKEPTKSDIINFFKGKKLEFEPGTNYHYSNAGYKILSWIVEAITNTDFGNQVDRIINVPLNYNMKLIRESFTDPRTSSYFELQDSILNPSNHWLWIKGDGGLTTTAMELAHLSFDLASGKIITKESYQKMIQSTDLGQGLIADFGLGINIGEFDGEKMIGHAGGYKTVKSMLVYFPNRQICIVVLVNTDNTPSNARNIFGKIALAVLGKKRPNYIYKELVDAELEKFVGQYKAPGENNAIYINLDTNDIHLYYSNDTLTKGEKLFSLGAGRFWAQSLPLDLIVFDTKTNNEVIGLREYYTGQYVLSRKKIGIKQE
jgi:CubicO group peptidase (beta-lactamase class C family)